MDDNPTVEEVLETVWTAVEEEEMDLVPPGRLGRAPDHPLLAEMVASGLLRHEHLHVLLWKDARRRERQCGGRCRRRGLSATC